MSCNFASKNGSYVQSWIKVLGIVLQYSYFSVISRFPLKTNDETNASGCYSTVKIEYAFIMCSLSFLLEEQGNYKRSEA